MNVWRIGSNWDSINLLDIFRRNKIVFAGLEVENAIKKVLPNDLICITNGQSIKAIGLVDSQTALSDINASYANEFAAVTAIKLKNAFWKDEYPDIDFSYYDGRGRQFHKAHGEYSKFIQDLYKQIMNTSEIQNSINLGVVL